VISSCRPFSWEDKPPKKPHLHIGSVDGLLFPETIAITGNATALLQLRDQIERALAGEEAYALEEDVYQDVNGVPFEVAVKWAKGKEEMEGPYRSPRGLPRSYHGKSVPEGWLRSTATGSSARAR
jgi:hypothetical protein